MNQQLDPVARDEVAVCQSHANRGCVGAHFRAGPLVRRTQRRGLGRRGGPLQFRPGRLPAHLPNRALRGRQAGGDRHQQRHKKPSVPGSSQQQFQMRHDVRPEGNVKMAGHHRNVKRLK